MSKRVFFLIMLFGTLITIAGAVVLTEVGLKEAAESLIGFGVSAFIFMGLFGLFMALEDEW